MKTPAKQKPQRARQSNRPVAAEKGIESKAQPGDAPPNVDFFNPYKGTLPETITQIELEKLNSSLGSFFALLRKARRLYLEEGDGGRAGAFTALGAMWKFIAIFEVPHAERLHVPILQLQSALAALEQNNVLPILKPVARGGRAVSSHAHASLRGFAAGTVKRLLEAGRDRKEASMLVAKELSKKGVEAERGSGRISANTIRHWCDEVANDVGRNGTAAMAYDSMCGIEENKKFESLKNAEAQTFALASLGHYVQELFPPLRTKLLKPT
jgi:hypothetical protein